MKIMHVCKKYPGVLGGDAVVVENLQKQQEAAGHEVSIVTSNCPEVHRGAHVYTPGLSDTSAGLDHITWRRVVSLLMLCVQMFAILRKERPNVIHTHSVDMAFFTSLAARMYRIPIIHTFHIVTFYDSAQSPLRRKTETWLAKKTKAHRITAPNNFDVKKLQEAGLPHATLLPNGVDLWFWSTSYRQRPGRAFAFVSVGRLEKQKGYDYLIKAAAMLAQTSQVEFRVVILGDGSQKAALHKLVDDLDIERVVWIAGQKTQSEVRKLMMQADAAVFPSLYETTPITLLEAWAASVPVITTSVGILRDMPEDFDGAYIVPARDQSALMLAMGRCMEDESSRVAIGTRGHEEAKKYDWPTIATQVESMYRSAL